MGFLKILFIAALLILGAGHFGCNKVEARRGNVDPQSICFSTEETNGILAQMCDISESCKCRQENTVCFGEIHGFVFTLATILDLVFRVLTWRQERRRRREAAEMDSDLGQSEGEIQ